MRVTRLGIADADEVKRLISCSGFFDVNCVDTVDRWHRCTPLYYAAWWGHTDVMQALLDGGADPDKDEIGDSPLHAAASRGLDCHREVVKMLLDGGAQPNLADTISGQTPLHLAAERGHGEVVQVLLENGSEPDMVDASGKTPLHMAALDGHHLVVELLLQSGANPNATEEDGKTPLHFAAEKGHTGVVKRLLENGSEPNMADGRGKTPLNMALEAGHYEIFVLLIESGANHMMAGGEVAFISDIHAALQFVSDGGLEEIVHILIRKGAKEELGTVSVLCINYICSKIELDVEDFWLT